MKPLGLRISVRTTGAEILILSSIMDGFNTVLSCLTEHSLHHFTVYPASFQTVIVRLICNSSSGEVTLAVWGVVRHANYSECSAPEGTMMTVSLSLFLVTWHSARSQTIFKFYSLFNIVIKSTLTLPKLV
jgi:hypothetical protein